MSRWMNHFFYSGLLMHQSQPLISTFLQAFLCLVALLFWATALTTIIPHLSSNSDLTGAAYALNTMKYIEYPELSRLARALTVDGSDCSVHTKSNQLIMMTYPLYIPIPPLHSTAVALWTEPGK